MPGPAVGFETLKRDAAEGFEELAGAPASIAASLAPHAIYTVSTESLAWIAEESERARRCRCRSTSSETEHEVADCLAAHGVRPVELLDRLGLLGPRTLLAHARLARRARARADRGRRRDDRDQPVANMKLAVGAAFDLPAARRHGIPVGLGTDGAGSNNSLDLLADAKHLALAAEASRHRPVRRSRGRGPRDRDGRARPAAGSRAARGGGAGRLPPRPHRPARALSRLARGGARLRVLGGGRRHDRRRRPGADARRASSTASRRSSRGPASAPRRLGLR